MTTATDEATNVSDHVVAGAGAIAEAFGLGDQVLPSSDWPTDDGDTVLVATLENAGGASLALAVNDEVAARLTSDPHRLTSGFERALAAIVDRGGIDASATVTAVEAADVTPTHTVEIQDGKQLCALFGIVLPTSPGDDGAGAQPGGTAPGMTPGATQSPASFEPAALAANGEALAMPSSGPLTLLEDVEMDVTVELGRTTMPIRELLALQPGMVVEIDRAAGTPIDVLVNGRRIACGEVVVIDEEFGIRITDIVDSRARI